MASKIMDLNKCVFYVQSGVANALGKTLAIEMCRRFKVNSVIVLIDANQADLLETKKEINALDNGLHVICCNLDSWHNASYEMFSKLLQEIMCSVVNDFAFELAFIMHNESDAASSQLMEPQIPNDYWQLFVQQYLNAAVALNQQFLKLKQLTDVPKLVINLSSTLFVKPLIYDQMKCSCKIARDMYFHTMADLEASNNVFVLTYSPGISSSHVPQIDENGNVVTVDDFKTASNADKWPLVKPIESTAKLIKILQELAFISGHDMDYYDTFVL